MEEQKPKKEDSSKQPSSRFKNLNLCNESEKIACTTAKVKSKQIDKEKEEKLLEEYNAQMSIINAQLEEKEIEEQQLVSPLV